jgi:hypothetical protein
MCASLLMLPLCATGAPETFRTSSNLVLVNVSVLDSHDRPVTTLARQLFRVLDNSREQGIRFP